MKAWICAFAIVLASAQPTPTRAYYKYVPPQPQAVRYQVVKTVEVIATKYFIPKREDYTTRKAYLKAVRMEGGNYTASQKKLQVGHIAANLKRFKIGTMVRIKDASNLIGTIEDTGEDMMENPNQIDIFTTSKQDAEKWGRRKVKMEIIKLVKA